MEPYEPSLEVQAAWAKNALLTVARGYKRQVMCTVTMDSRWIKPQDRRSLTSFILLTLQLSSRARNYPFWLDKSSGNIIVNCCEKDFGVGVGNIGYCCEIDIFMDQNIAYCCEIGIFLVKTLLIVAKLAHSLRKHCLVLRDWHILG